jgi:hypothetical protein
MRETRSSGSVRGASGDGRPYRERIVLKNSQMITFGRSSRNNSSLFFSTGIILASGSVQLTQILLTKRAP